MKNHLRGIAASLPIAAGYFPVAFTFGVAAEQSGAPPGLALLISALVFAGASQFVLLSLLGSGAGLLAGAVAMLAVNVRHVFYGPPIRTLLATDAPRSRLAMVAAGLTDEVFATAMARLPNIPSDARMAWCLGLETGAYLSWVGGTWLGASSHAVRVALPPSLIAAQRFVLPALLFSLLIDAGKRSGWIVPCAAAAMTVMARLTVPAHWAIVVGMATGALVAARERGAST